jgi:hypothetical protein
MEDYKKMTKHELGNAALEFGWDSEGGEAELNRMSKQELLDWISENTKEHTEEDGFKHRISIR